MSSLSLTDRLRQLLAGIPGIEEKKMFGRTAFKLDGKLCITAGGGKLMCRIDPAMHAAYLQEEGCSEMLMRSKPVKGYIYVDEAVMPTKKTLERWVNLSIAFTRTVKK
ncbi:TfoX/Sxy family protein [uncultured Chitinophaga sp.]|uniref:TfoX/Sxy family protein n=1 Tax=uncultured Chitinophaga sp. TaxID=339340 RepID=UPI0026014BA9|nr:TfoX/Sxy family protein [uncultured Chitinophaga sp.]